MDERHCKTCVCGCTCGFGGEHVEDNPRCALTAKSDNDVCEHQNANYLRMMSERDALHAEVERLREDYQAACEARMTFHDELDEAQRQVADLRARIGAAQRLLSIFERDGDSNPYDDLRTLLAGSGEQPGKGERAWLNADPRKAAENLRAVVGAGEQPGEDAPAESECCEDGEVVPHD